MASREEVYKAIDSERDYQDAQRPDRFTEPVLPISGELLCIQEYLNRTNITYVTSAGETPLECLNGLRKIAAMCVRAMEHHGAPKR